MELINENRVPFKRLRRYIELNEQIKRLKEEQDLIKDEIKLKFAGGKVVERDGFRYGTEMCVKTGWDMEALERTLGSEVTDPFKYETAYDKIVVKPLVDALKSKL